ncbi:MAG: hypothetical protein LBK46_07105 [Oscillospiraceae bacterium]|jgi:hypothetical protein|nr:hypothetical protein [Oscillospiraceae bacterium]
MELDLSTIIETLLLVCCFVAIRLVKPWIKAHTTLEQREALNTAMDTFVDAAEQVFGSGHGQAKLAQVLEWSKSEKIDAGEADVEAAVWRLKKSRTAGNEQCGGTAGGEEAIAGKAVTGVTEAS